MHLFPLKTPRINSGDDLFSIFQKALTTANQTLQEGDIIVVASKIVAVQQHRVVAVKDDVAFAKLVEAEADRVVADCDEWKMRLTLKNGALIPNAGIDRSNVAAGHAVLWPADPFGWAQAFCARLKKEHGLKMLGVVVSDSHCQPLRCGTSGLALGWAGFRGVQDERGAGDLFGHAMQYTRIAVADNLASAALLMMGETNASTPFVLVNKAPVHFSNKHFSEKDAVIPPEEDLYKSLYGNRI